MGYRFKMAYLQSRKRFWCVVDVETILNDSAVSVVGIIALAKKMSTTGVPQAEDPRQGAITKYRKKFLEHRELETRIKKSTLFGVGVFVSLAHQLHTYGSA